MGDRELLEWAAKAAGLKVLQRGEGYWMIEFHDRGMRGWNPLLSDKDALRLAVKLDMQIWRNIGGTVTGMPPSGDFWQRLREPLDPDPYAATRRAIVRAAAEIGKATASAGEGGKDA